MAAILGAVAAGFVVLMLIAGLQGTPEFRDVAVAPTTREPIVVPTQTFGPAQTPQPIDENAAAIAAIIAAAVSALVGLAWLALVVWLVLRLVRSLGERRRSRRRGVATSALSSASVPSESEDDAALVRQGVDGAIDNVLSARDPGDAIVAAWLGLEESSTRFGQIRGTAETPAEFVVRIIGRRQAIGDDAAALLRLYEGVRFGAAAASETDRAAARAHLEAIREEWR